MRRLLVVLAVMLGCGKTYQELAPITCAQDHLCPDPLVCILENGTGICREDQRCTPGSSDCRDVTRPRCTIMRIASQLAASECTVQYAQATEGQGCALILYSTDTSGLSPGLGTNFPGEDRFCNNGLICHSPTLTPATQGVSFDAKCRRFCSADADCGSSALSCLDAFGKTVTSAAVSVPKPTGVCYPSCALLSSGQCPAGSACQVAIDVSGSSGFGLCRVPGSGNSGQGTGAEDSSCSEATPCLAGFGCVPSGNAFACKRLCTSSVACKSTQSCDTALFPLAGGVGLCR